MQLLLLTNARKKALSLTLGPYSLLGLILLTGSLCLVIFYGGNQYEKRTINESLAKIYTQTAPVWNQEISAQREILELARHDAEKNLDALATRLSKLQAHIMRLDALGARLADIANLEDFDIDVLDPLGIGGPASNSLQESMEISDFIKSLDELAIQIEDKGEKLVAMESMLIDLVFQEQTLPAGRPVTGGWISSIFGPRADPMTGKKEFHEGIDFAGKPGSPILAVATGIVTWSGKQYGYGNLVEIDHGNGYRTRYAHNKKNLAVLGQKVEQGEMIALMGSSGHSTGTHLHFEVIQDNRQVNQSKYLKIN